MIAWMYLGYVVMTFDEAVVQIELGRLSHVNDDFALGVVNELRETYAKPFEMGPVDYRTVLLLKEKGFTFKGILVFPEN